MNSLSFRINTLTRQYNLQKHPVKDAGEFFTLDKPESQASILSTICLVPVHNRLLQYWEKKMNWWKIEPKCMEQNHLWNLWPKSLVPLEPSSQNAVALGMVMEWQTDVRIGSSGFSFKQFLSDLITLLLSLTQFKFHRWVGLIPALPITGLS